MPTITGNLKTSSTDPVQGQVEVMLCGYGSRVPRVNGTGLVARITDTADIPVDSSGAFTFNVYGNDLISPAGTYYAVTIRDDNGDIAQINAYRFLSTTPTYDLDLIDPYDPNQPPPPLPPLITNMLQIVGLQPSNSWDCDGGNYLSFKINATQNGLIDIQYVSPGNLYTFIVVQDATGGRQVTWAANILNAAPVNPMPNGITVQTFVCDDQNNLYAIGPGTYYP